MTSCGTPITTTRRATVGRRRPLPSGGPSATTASAASTTSPTVRCHVFSVGDAGWHTVGGDSRSETRPHGGRRHREIAATISRSSRDAPQSGRQGGRLEHVQLRPQIEVTSRRASLTAAGITPRRPTARTGTRRAGSPGTRCCCAFPRASASRLDERRCRCRSSRRKPKARPAVACGRR